MGGIEKSIQLALGKLAHLNICPAEIRLKPKDFDLLKIELDERTLPFGVAPPTGICAITLAGPLGFTLITKE